MNGKAVYTFRNSGRSWNIGNEKLFDLLNKVDYTISFADTVIDQDICELFRRITPFVPHLTEEVLPQLQVSQITIGTSNHTFKCSWPTGRTVIVRIFGKGSEYLVDRSQELQLLMLASQSGLGPKLHVLFNNGYVCECLPGRILSPEEMKEPYFSERIATKMSEWHRLPIKHRQSESSTSIFIHRMLDSWKSFDSEDPDLHLAIRELGELERAISACNPKLVLCHNDVNSANIIYNADTGSLAFIDYEQAGLNYAAYDIADHFCEFAGLDLDFSRYPSKQEQFVFFEHYLGKTNATEESMEALYKDVCKFALMAHLVWFVWAKLQTHISDIDYFDYHKYAQDRIAEYWRRKSDFLNIKN